MDEEVSSVATMLSTAAEIFCESEEDNLMKETECQKSDSICGTRFAHHSHIPYPQETKENGLHPTRKPKS